MNPSSTADDDRVTVVMFCLLSFGVVVAVVVLVAGPTTSR
jgi:hypothetical protein